VSIPLKQYWALLSNYLRPQWRRASLLAVLLLAHIALRLVNPQVMRLFIDAAVLGEGLSKLLGLALTFLLVALIDQGLAIANTRLGEDVAWVATNALRHDLTLHCLRLDQSFHKAHTSGELIERIDGDVSVLANFFSRLVVDVAGNGMLLAGILALLFREDWRVGLGLTAFAALSLLAMFRVRAIAIPFWVQVRQQSADFCGFLGERLAGTEEIRANGAQNYVMRRFYEIMRRWLPIQVKAGVARNATWMVGIGMYALGNAIAFLLGAHLWDRGSMTIGTVYLIVRYTDLLFYPLAQIRAQIADLQQAEASIVRVRVLSGTSSRLRDGAGDLLPHGPLSVDLREVSFGYDEGEIVLQDISLRLRPGRVLGLLGRTGSGKTTFARLLLRLYDPTGGEIRLGGVVTTATCLRDLRDRVGMVTQDVQLFQATVRDNVTLFNPNISDERIVSALSDLGLSGWLERLPAGLDTELQAGGSDLSAGQAQLLAFARVFLVDPGLVILDEASSRLDPATDRLVERAVDRLLQGRTAIVIAHRLSTVHRADEIAILEDGRILEHGEHTALAGDPGSHFHRLLQAGLEEVLV
jgi:ATP-binding cassette subfamily B protein